MPKLEFKPSDFYSVSMAYPKAVTQYCPEEFQCERLAKCAQELFDEWYRENVENAPILYGTTVGKTKLTWSDSPWVNLHKMKADGPEKCSTHTARLICIEKIGGKDE